MALKNSIRLRLTTSIRSEVIDTGRWIWLGVVGKALDAIGGMSSITWHPGIPPPPKGFPQTATLRLTRDEAQFIEDQIITTQPNSLFARIIPLPLADVDYPWQHPSLSRFTQEQRDLLHHADLFSQAMYGAAILYNLMLARKKASAELVKARLEDAKEWLQSLDRVGLDKWELDWVMPLAFNHQQAVSPHTLEFCKRWVELVRASGNSIMKEKTAQNLIQSREMRLKVRTVAILKFSGSRSVERQGGTISHGLPLVYGEEIHSGFARGTGRRMNA